MQYDQKRYRIAPWRGTFGDQAHCARLHKNRDMILAAIEAKKAQIQVLAQQLRQLEVLEDKCRGTMLDGRLVREINGSPETTKYYQIALVGTKRRSAETYPNAHNGGATYGLRVFRDDYPYRQEWCGAGHTKDEAVDGARAWVLSGEMPPHRYKTTKKETT